MAIYIAPKNRIPNDGKKYFYKFSYKNKQYASKLFKTKKEAELSEEDHRLSLLKKDTIKKEKIQHIKDITFKELYDEFYEYKLDKVKQTTLYSYRMRIPLFEILYDTEVSSFDSSKYLYWR